MVLFSDTVLQSIFPEQCVGCNQYDVLICASCTAKALAIERLILPESSPITSLITLGEYSTPVWKMAIKRLKFSHVRGFAEPLGQLLAGALLNADIEQGNASSIVLLPLPLHTRRLRERGYNQSTLLAESIRCYTGWSVNEQILERTQYAVPQSSLDHTLRQENIRDAYTLGSDAPLLQNTVVILIDDVITTGATLLEAAWALQELQPRAVHGAAIARGN